MLYNEQEISLMANAIQPNMRNKTSIVPFQHIVQDFFTQEHFQGKHVVDLGPGQCDFLDIAKHCGAITYGVDFDPCVTQLGKLRGHNMAGAQNFQETWPYEKNKFDGIFCRGSLNYYATVKNGPQDAIAFLSQVFSSLKPGGWIWIAPWAKFAEEQADIASEVFALVHTFLKKHGVTIAVPSKGAVTHYGVDYVIPRIEIWIRHLHYFA